jgi:mannose-6-phosphate isomerase-like protein (cupin superfamily)
MRFAGCLAMFAALSLAPALVTGQTAPLPATDVTAAGLMDFIAALPKDRISDSPVRIVDVGNGLRIGLYGVFRPKSVPGDAVLHESKTSETYVMLEGSGTLVTGGTLVGRKPGEGTLRGERIDGGVSRRVVKGDVVVIPGRTPHWWSQLESDIKYMIIRSDPEGRLTLK